MPDTSPPRPARRRWLLWLLLFAVLFGLSGLWVHQRMTDRTRVLEAITAASGRFSEPRSNSFADLFERMFGQRVDNYGVYLDGPEFDDAWLEQHRDLRAIPLEELIVRNTQISRQGLLRLLDEHDVATLSAPGIPLTDADARRIGEEPRLDSLNLTQTEITNVGLSSLKIHRLRGILSVAGTPITATGLRRELAGAQIRFLIIDGKQLTPELAADIAQMRSIAMLALVGPDVGDAQVKLLETMPHVTYFRIEQSSASEEAVAALRSARPAPVTVEVPAPNQVFYKWRPE